jgi:MFS family permease
MNSIPRTVVVLGFVSFFTDLSTEMIAPLLPVFLTTVLLAGPAAIGLIEGLAESTSSILKLVSGWWADRVPRKKPLVFAGYGISSVVRPLIAFAATWPFVLFIRFFDRVGKGIRTSPRDALIADSVDASIRGKAYGFHRSMDHAGAVVGPLAAYGLMKWGGFEMRHVFLATAIPAIVVILLLWFGLKETPRPVVAAKAPPNLIKGAKDLGTNFWAYLAALLIFTLGNSTDAFILLLLSAKGVGAGDLALLWAGFHVVKMVSTYWGGTWSDRLGRRQMILMGWGVYALVYFGFAQVGSTAGLIAVFMTYGVFFGFTEPAEKAWVADLVKPEARGTAFGYYHMVIGLGALPASVLFGWIWKVWGAPTAFFTGAGLAALAAVALMFARETRTGAKV